MTLSVEDEPNKPDWLSKLTSEEIQQIQANGISDSRLHELIDVAQTTLNGISNHEDESRRKNPSEKCRGKNKEKLLPWYVKEKNGKSLWFIKESFLNNTSDP